MSNELSVKMSAWLAHVRAASEQGVSIAAYAAAQGLSAAALYQAKSELYEYCCLAVRHMPVMLKILAEFSHGLLRGNDEPASRRWL